MADHDGQVLIGIKLDYEGFQKDLTETKKVAESTGKAVEKAVNPDTRGLTEMKSKWQDVRTVAEQTRVTMNNLRDAQDKLTRLYKSGSIGEKEYRQLRKEIAEAQDALKGYSQEFNSATREFDRGSEKIRTLTQESDRLSVALEKIVQDTYDVHKEFYTNADALDEVVDAALNTNKEFQKLSERYEQINDKIDQHNKRLKESAESQEEYAGHINDTAKATKEMSSQLEKARNPISILQVAFGNLIAQGISKATSAINDFISSSIELASSLETSEIAIERTFGEHGTERINRWADEAKESFGLSEASAKSFASEIGFVVSQYTDVEAKITSVSLALLEGIDDWAAYLGVAPDKAVEATTAAIAGNYQALRQLRVPINDAVLDNSRYVRSLGATYSQLSENQKATARWNYILELMEDATGAAADSQDSYTRQLWLFDQAAEEAKIALGRELLPTLTDIIKEFNKNSDAIRDVAQAIGRFLDFIARLVLQLSKLPGWVFPVTIAFAALFSILLKLAPAIIASSKALPPAGAALGAFGASAGAAVPVILSLTAAAIALAAVFTSIGYLIGKINSNKLDLGVNDISRQISELKNSLGSLSAYATGTNHAKTGWALVGERGPELVRMAGGEQVLNATATSNALRAMSAAPVGMSPALNGGYFGGISTTSNPVNYYDNRQYSINPSSIPDLQRAVDYIKQRDMDRIRARASGALS